MRHENINPFIGASVDSGNICILSLYCARGSLEVSVHCPRVPDALAAAAAAATLESALKREKTTEFERRRRENGGHAWVGANTSFCVEIHCGLSWRGCSERERENEGRDEGTGKVASLEREILALISRSAATTASALIAPRILSLLT